MGTNSFPVSCVTLISYSVAWLLIFEGLLCLTVKLSLPLSLLYSAKEILSKLQALNRSQKVEKQLQSYNLEPLLF